MEETPDIRTRATSSWTDDPRGGGRQWGADWDGVMWYVAGEGGGWASVPGQNQRTVED